MNSNFRPSDRRISDKWGKDRPKPLIRNGIDIKMQTTVTGVKGGETITDVTCSEFARLIDCETCQIRRAYRLKQRVRGWEITQYKSTRVSNPKEKQ